LFLSISSNTPLNPLRSICVFCGSSAGDSPAFRDASLELADVLSEAEITLVYGGARIGLMGAVADRVLERDGRVVGVIPQSLLDVEIAHNGLTQLHVTDGMHERKAKMASESDAFIAMPGGLGTLEELFEVLTWAQLGYHTKPIGILNVDGYYDDLLRFIENATDRGFMRLAHKDLLHVATDAHRLLELLSNAQPLQDKKL